MREYEIDIAGLKHTVLLDDEDAAARGLTAKSDQKSAEPKAKAPTNKAKAPANKAKS